METYSQYRFEDFYRKHYYEGGLALCQVNLLYDTALERKKQHFHFMAALQGVDLDKERESSQFTQDDDNNAPQAQQSAQNFLFGDPKQYEHMSAEEKDALTQKMMRYHKKTVGFRGN